MLPQESRDGSNDTPCSEFLLLPGKASQFTPPKAAQPADLAVAVQVTEQAAEAPEDSNWPGSRLCHCKICGRLFKKPHELGRHLREVHQQKRRCPFGSCKYNWKRADKIKAHITNVHSSNLCPLVTEGVRALRGKDVIEFVNAYDFESLDSTMLLPLPLLASEAPSGEFKQHLRCVFLKLDNQGMIWLTSISDYCECHLETIERFSSEGVVEQVVEEATT